MFQKVLKLIRFLPCLPKTVLFNFYYFPFKTAVRFPVFVSSNVYFEHLGGHVVLHKIHAGIIRLGMSGIGDCRGKSTHTLWRNEGTIEFLGSAVIRKNSKIAVTGTATFGDNFSVNEDSTIVAANKITFGNNVLVSSDVSIMDTDFHHIRNKDGDILNAPRPIHIGNHVWIGFRSTILKGSTLADDTVVAASSTVTGTFNDRHCIIGGVPAKIIKRDVHWSR